MLVDDAGTSLSLKGTNMKQLKQAQQIKRNLGIRACRGYMRNRDWSLAAKLYVLILC